MSVTSAQQRKQRLRILREAEGYLDLVYGLCEPFACNTEVRDRVALRAIDTLGRLDALSAARPEALYLYGQTLRVMERYQDAIGPLSKAAEAEPENVHIWLALGWCHKRAGRLDMAIQSLEEAISVDPLTPIVHYNLACYWSLAGRVEQAVLYLQQAFDMDSNYRDLAATEPDFDAIRDDPEFQAALTVIV